MPRCERQHHRHQPCRTRPSQQRIQFTAPDLGDPFATARTEPDRAANLQTAIPGPCRAVLVCGQRDLNPMLPRNHRPSASSDPLIRQQTCRRSLMRKIQQALSLPPVFAAPLVNGFRITTKSGCTDFGVGFCQRTLGPPRSRGGRRRRTFARVWTM